jgi:CRP-like cAMP-binding protein
VGLGDPLTRRLAAESAERVYAIGEPVMREGDPGASMFVILSGRVEVTTREGDGPVIRLAALGPGDSFGEMSLLTGAPRTATVTASEETRLIELGKEPLRHAFEARPDLVDELGRLLQKRAAERMQAVAGAPPPAPEEQDLFRKIRDFFSL